MTLKFKGLIKKYTPHAKNFSFYLFATLLNTILMLAINPFLAKNLSHSDYAIIGFHNSFQILLIPLLSFSLTNYYIRTYYLTPELERDSLRDTIMQMTLIWGSGSIILCYTFFYFFFRFKNVDIPFFPYFIFTITTVFANNFVNMLQIDNRLNRRAKQFFKVAIGLRIAVISFSIVLVIFLKLGALGRMSAMAFCTIIYGVFTFRKMYKGNKIDWNIAKKAMKFCWPLALSAFLWYFLGGVDRIFLEELKDVNSMGLYNIAVGLAGKFGIFYMALAQTVEPDVYKSIAIKKYKRLVFISLGLIALNAIPNILFIIFAKPIINIFTYGRYVDATPFAQILTLKNISMSLYYTVIMIIVGLGFTKSELMNRLFGAILCYFMFKFMIEKFGFYGAAWGQSIAFIIMTIIGIVFILFNKKKMMRSAINA